MWNRFRKVLLVSGDATAYRRASVMRELERVGIAAHPGFKMLRGSFKEAHAAHESALREIASAWKEGGTSLILEDDIRFLKDLDMLRDVIAHAPAADIVSFDPFLHFPEEEIAAMKRSPYYRWRPGVVGASCYSIAPVAAQVLCMSYMRHPAHPPDSQVFLGHQDLYTVVSSVHACVQLTYAKSVNVARYGENSQHEAYMRERLDYSMYAVPEGFGYGKVLDEGGEVLP